jgi:hypothetical protein
VRPDCSCLRLRLTNSGSSRLGRHAQFRRVDSGRRQLRAARCAPRRLGARGARRWGGGATGCRCRVAEARRGRADSRNQSSAARRGGRSRRRGARRGNHGLGVRVPGRARRRAGAGDQFLVHRQVEAGFDAALGGVGSDAGPVRLLRHGVGSQGSTTGSGFNALGDRLVLRLRAASGVGGAVRLRPQPARRPSAGCRADRRYGRNRGCRRALRNAACSTATRAPSGRQGFSGRCRTPPRLAAGAALGLAGRQRVEVDQRGRCRQRCSGRRRSARCPRAA